MPARWRERPVSCPAEEAEAMMITETGRHLWHANLINVTKYRKMIMRQRIDDQQHPLVLKSRGHRSWAKKIVPMALMMVMESPRDESVYGNVKWSRECATVEPSRPVRQILRGVEQVPNVKIATPCW